VFRWEVRTLKYPHRGGVVVDSSRGAKGGGDDGGRGHEIVGKGVVEVALQFEDVLYSFEFFFISAQHATESVRVVLRDILVSNSANPSHHARMLS
jgi:hypothetical protein